MTHQKVSGTLRTIALLDAILRPLELIAAVIAGIMMVLAMLFMTGDALLRYAFNSPLNWNLFVSENYLLVGLVCMPLAWGFRTGGYIRISYLLHAIPEKAGNLLIRVGLLASSMFAAEMTWFSALKWFENWEKGLIEMDVIDFPWHWSWIWVPIGLGLLSARLFIMAFGPNDKLDPASSEEEAL